MTDDPETHSEKSVQKQMRSILGIVAESTKRDNESFDIDTVKVGEFGKAEPAVSYPLIRTTIRHPSSAGSEDFVTLGRMTARPIFDDEHEESLTTGIDLEKNFIGYSVTVDLCHREYDAFPPYDIDWDEHGFESPESADGSYRFQDTVSIKKSASIIRDLMGVLRSHRE